MSFKKELLKNPKFKKEYERLDIPFEFGETIVDFRIKHGLTQKKLAQTLGIKESLIIKLES